MEKYVIVIEFVSNDEATAYDVYTMCRNRAFDRLGPKRGVAALYIRKQIKLERDILEKDMLIKADQLGY